ncbi:MAG: type II toxin-antitoxin system HicA family toxin [Deltaproteobacteria bacterium]|nr:type II toxin-antitoxin system HicA family toxin [Deltaproteobacteria bacterium]
MPMTGKEMVKYYKKHGWTQIRQTGSHVIMFKEGKGSQSIPVHSNGDLGKGLESKLLKEV